MIERVFSLIEFRKWVSSSLDDGFVLDGVFLNNVCVCFRVQPVKKTQ